MGDSPAVDAEEAAERGHEASNDVAPNDVAPNMAPNDVALSGCGLEEELEEEPAIERKARSNMEAPGQVVVETEEDKATKKRCIRLYRNAHQKCCERYDELIAKLETKANEVGKGRNPNEEVAAKYQARADAVKAMKAKTEDDFEGWYEQDKKEFDKVDVNGNQVLEVDEFQKYLKDTYKMSDSECKTAMEKWDVDNSQNIGPYEWCTFKSVHRAEFNLMMEKLVTDVVIRMVDRLFPCGIGCYTYCGLCACYFCCPTLGLSCVPFMCLSKCLVERMASPEFQEKIAKETEEAMEEAQCKSIQAAKAAILVGPSDMMRSSVTKAQTNEGTPLLDRA